MKNHGREFIKKAMAGLAIVSLPIFLTLCTGEKQDHSNETQSNNMKKLKINEIIHEGLIDIDQAEKLLENNADFQVVGTINWAEYPYKPEVKFKIAYNQDQILLKYYVTEESILAKETRVNGSVHKDSCVEFFVTPGGDAYYNFEISCIGIPHVGYGEARSNRVLIDPEILKLITIKSTLGNQPFEEKTGGYQWEMMIVIPKECLAFNKGIKLKGLSAKANFYKCGDDTSTPHFVTWNPVGTKTPDYHRPEYFGELSFK